MTRNELQNKSAISVVLGHYMKNPKDFKSYPLTREDIINFHQLVIYDTLVEMIDLGYKEIDSVNMALYLRENNPSRYLSFDKHQCAGHVEQMRVLPDDFIINYNTVKKFTALREAFDKKIDFSDLLIDDFILTDEGIENQVKFNKMTIQELIDHLQERHKNQISSIKEKLGDCCVDEYTDYDFDNLPYSEPKQPLIEGMMLQNTMDSIIAPAKAGKSFLSYQMAYAVQNGFEFLGRKTTQTDVLYVDFELRNDAIAERGRKVKELYNGEGKPFKVMPLSSSWGSSVISLDKIIDKIKTKKEENPNLGLVIFDCYYRFAEGEENSADDTNKTLSKLKALTGDMTVVYVHHTNKRPTDIDINKLDSATVLIQASGSVVHTRVVDQTYYIHATKDGSYIFNTGRDWYDDRLACVRNELGYFELDCAETYPNGENKRYEIATKRTKTALESLTEDYPEIVEFIEQNGNEYGVGKKALVAFCEEEYGEAFSVADFKEMGLIYTGSHKREDDIPSDRFMLP